MKKILLLHTGGTIAMEENNEGNGIRLSENHPLSGLQSQLQSIASIHSEEVFNLPSPHIGPKTVLELANYIRDRVAKERFDGVVITHGTDTLEETAYMLELLSPCQQPIVLTGAMKPSNERGSDGPNNVISAVRVAACQEAVNLGVVVVMNDEIHSAKYVTKMHTSSVAAFESPLSGPLGIVIKNDVIFYHYPKRERAVSINEIEKKVHLLKLYSGIEYETLEWMEKMNLDGLVIEAFGSGNVPPEVVPFIKRLLKRHIPVVVVSRSVKGTVQGVYSYEGGGSQLQDLGVIFLKGLSGQKARIKLLLFLHETTSIPKLEKMLHEK